MQTTLTISHMLVRITGVLQLILGLLMWTEPSFFYVRMPHMVLGVVFVLSLWVLAAVSTRGGGCSRLPDQGHLLRRVAGAQTHRRWRFGAWSFRLQPARDAGQRPVPLDRLPAELEPRDEAHAYAIQDALHGCLAAADDW